MQTKTQIKISRPLQTCLCSSSSSRSIATTIILNKVPPGIDPAALTERAEKAFGIPVLAVLPLSEGVMTLGSEGIFGLNAPDDPYARGVQAIAARLMRS